jgi:putative Holliday junction resolvase
MELTKFLGIDYGEKRVGIATSDSLANLAFPHSVIQNSKNLIQDIKTIIKRENITGVVVGESKDFKGEKNKIMEKIEPFVEELKQVSGAEVYMEPEFLTSHQAEKIQGKNDMLDASSATIILQSFLDKRKNGL